MEIPGKSQPYILVNNGKHPDPLEWTEIYCVHKCHDNNSTPNLSTNTLVPGVILGGISPPLFQCLSKLSLNEPTLLTVSIPFQTCFCISKIAVSLLL